MIINIGPLQIDIQEGQTVEVNGQRFTLRNGVLETSYVAPEKDTALKDAIDDFYEGGEIEDAEIIM